MLNSQSVEPLFLPRIHRATFPVHFFTEFFGVKMNSKIQIFTTSRIIQSLFKIWESFRENLNAVYEWTPNNPWRVLSYVVYRSTDHLSLMMCPKKGDLEFIKLYEAEFIYNIRYHHSQPTHVSTRSWKLSFISNIRLKMKGFLFLLGIKLHPSNFFASFKLR